MSESFWSRVRRGRLYHVFVVYLGGSWIVLQAVDVLRSTLTLPDWIGLATLILLVVGLFVAISTAWVHPYVRTHSEESPEAAGAIGAAKQSARKPRPFLTWQRAALGGAVAFLLLFGFAGMFVLLRDRGAQAATRKAPDAIAVLPFTVRGAGLADLREGMVDLLSTGLDGSAGLRTVASRSVLARWSESVPENSLADERTALDVARKAGARYALTGSAVSAGRRMRLALDVHDLYSDQRLGQAQVEGPPDSVLTLVDRLAVQTLALILRKDTLELPQVNLASITTTSLPALKSYLEGEVRFRRGDFEAAERAYQQAVQYDSTFALAYYRLGSSYGWVESLGGPRSAKASARAMQLANRLPEREALFIRALDAAINRHESVIPRLQEAVRQYPNDAEAWYILADAYLHTPNLNAGWEEVEEAISRAIQLAPRFAPYRIHYVDAALQYHVDSALVRERLTELERLSGGKSLASVYRTAASFAFGDSAERARAFADFDRSSMARKQLIDAVLLSAPFSEIALSLLQREFASGTTDERGRARGLSAAVYLFNRGQARNAYTAIADPSVPEDMKWDMLYWAKLADVPSANAKLDSAGARSDVNKASRHVALVMGAHAAERGQWPVYHSAVTRLRAHSDSMRMAGDTLAARVSDSLIRTLEGISAWKRGRHADAIRLLQNVRGTDLGYYNWWLGQLYQETNRPAEAARYYRTYHSGPRWAAVTFPMAVAYEQSGDLEKARRHYGYFVENWANADADVQSRVEAAKKALVRLSDDRRR